MTIDSAVFTQVTAQCLYTFLWVPLLPKIAPSHRESELLSNAWFLGPIGAHNPNSTSIGSAVFVQMTAECPYTLQWNARFPPLPPFKITLPMGDLDPI